MNEAALHQALRRIAAKDAVVSEALGAVGMPAPRRAQPGFESLTRILVGQQLSVKAAASIYSRFEDLLSGEISPKSVLAEDQDTLRSAGLSFAKIRYIKALAQAVESGALGLKDVAELDEADAMKTLMSVKGIGPWTAQIYLLFCEGRQDVWPAGDMALQEGLRRLKGLEDRPSAKETLPLVAPWSPYRGAMAVFLWHYYAASDAPI